MLVADNVGVRTEPRPPPCAPPSSGGYLEMLNLFRVVACGAVLASHSFIWADMSENVIGTGFITMLHLSRNAFFFLSGLVVCYSQIVHPRAPRAFWRRRYVQLGVPYLAWTAIYLLFSWITISDSWVEVGTFLRHNLSKGYSQLYAVIVIFQFYLVLPLLLRLLRATPRHLWIMTASLTFAVALGLDLHYPAWVPFVSHMTTAVNSVWPWARNLLMYQEFFVAGALVAFHFDQVIAFVAVHYRRIWFVTAIAGGLMVMWYSVQVATGNSVDRASEVSQPPAVIWCFAAIAGIFSLSWWWNQKVRLRRGGSGERAFRSVGYAAALTGGIYFSHTLFITTIRSALAATGLRAHLSWEATVATFFFGTAITAGAFASLLLRTRLRWVLGGPDRAAQAAAYGTVPPSSPASGLHEGNTHGQKSHEGGDQREKCAPRPAEAGRLEEEGQDHEGQIGSGHEGQELILGHAARNREVADAERCDQDIENQDDRVRHRDEQPAVDTEPISGGGPQAVPRQPERHEEDEGSGADDPIPGSHGVQPVMRLLDALGRRS